MDCKYQHICGGCPLRHLSQQDYCEQKTSEFKYILNKLKQKDLNFGDTVFINDGLRRRADMSFKYRKNSLIMGFNAAQSHDIIDVTSCLSLTDDINRTLPKIREFLTKFCTIKQNKRVKNKIITSCITEGDIFITNTDNGLDILLKIEEPLELEHRMEISEFIDKNSEIIRFSVSHKNSLPETVAEKTKPYIKMGEREVLIPSGTFLQASTQGQQALIDLVLHYVGNDCGRIADLFCGVGTFSYPLSQNIKNKITAIDSSPELLEGFQQTVNKLMIPNIKIIRKNLFKYPLDSVELKDFDIIVFDPPRAGAKAQVEQIALTPHNDKPQKVIAISCNPYTFVNDADTLINGEYKIKKITMVDQFVYTKHMELVALFEKN